MKAPKYFIATMQDAIDAGVNPFAFQLMAESFADDPDRFKGENVILLSHAHNGQQVWFIMTKTQPVEKDFDGGPIPVQSTEPTSCTAALPENLHDTDRTDQ